MHLFTQADVQGYIHIRQLCTKQALGKPFIFSRFLFSILQKTFHFFFADSISAQTLEKDENGVMQMQLLSIQTDRGKEKSYPRLQAEC